MADAAVTFREVAIVVPREARPIFMFVAEAEGAGPIADEAIIGLHIGRSAGLVVRRDLRDM